ncbi:Polyubiqutin 1, partial [Glomus cerebriforme]
DYIHKNSLMKEVENVRREIQIFIKPPFEDSQTMFVTLDKTVIELIRKIQDMLGYEIAHLRLEFTDKILENNRTLASYDIKQGDSIVVEKIGNVEVSQIKIFIKSSSGESQAMFVNPSKTVLELIHMIQKKLGYEIAHLRLEFIDKILEDYNRTLASYDIKQGDIIVVEKIRNVEFPQIQIFIKPLSEESQAMFVNPNKTVLELKRMIQEKLGHEVSQMRLGFADKILEDHKTLASYDIKKGDNIHILFRLLGG